MTKNTATTRVRALVGAAGFVALLALAVVGLPILLIRPFSPQTPTTVAVAYQIRSISPWVAPTLSALAAVLGVLALRQRPPRPLVVTTWMLILAGAGAGWLSRQNHFEWMFAPLPSPEYARTRDVTGLANRDMVVAVERGGDAVAYPVRWMAYHHLVNDEVGGVPVVSTY